MLFFLESLSMSQKSVHLQCVFHSIRFKVNKGWSTAVLLFLCSYFPEYLYQKRKLPQSIIFSFHYLHKEKTNRKKQEMRVFIINMEL